MSGCCCVTLLSQSKIKEKSRNITRSCFCMKKSKKIQYHFYNPLTKQQCTIGYETVCLCTALKNKDI